MTIERDIEQAFERHAADAEPSPGAWSALERRIHRSHRVRVVAFSTLGAAAVIAAAVIVPRVVDRRQAIPVVSPEPAGSSTTPASPSPSASQATVGYRDDDAGWVIAFDATWKSSVFEGVTDIYPPQFMAPAAGGPVAAISIQILSERYDAPMQQHGGPTWQGTSVGGRKAIVAMETPSPTEHRVVYRLDWDQGATLNAAVYASTPELWDAWSPVMIDVVEHISAPSGSAAFPGLTRTKHGEVASGVAYDARTVALVRFLNARVEQGGAEAFMTAGAQQQYADSKNDLGLYHPRAVGDFYTRYEVLDRQPSSHETERFTVRLYADTGRPDNLDFVSESVVVGPGASSDAPLVQGATFGYEQCGSCPPIGPGVGRTSPSPS